MTSSMHSYWIRLVIVISAAFFVLLWPFALCLIPFAFQVIDNFKEKVQQMKELRRANLEKLVEKLREQIREYWEKCYYR